MSDVGQTAQVFAALARRSLQEIEDDDWGDPEPDDTGLVKTCMRLRRKPLGEFDDGDVVTLLDQRISWPTLVPMALGMLVVDPWRGGDRYLGDLICSLARVKDGHWQAHPDQARVFQQIVEQVLTTLDADPGFAPGFPGSETEVPDHYPGAAVFAIMGIPASYWQAHPDQYQKMLSVVGRASSAGLLSDDELEYYGALYPRPSDPLT